MMILPSDAGRGRHAGGMLTHDPLGFVMPKACYRHDAYAAGRIRGLGLLTQAAYRMTEAGQ
jgi:hypothetical protein